jgi:multisubunit Na+/H+ antiporter MnhB subunit
VAGNEPVTSPDQHKPGVSPRLLRAGALISAVVIVLMAAFGNHRGRVENIWMYAIGAGLVVMLVIDWVLRRNGMKS